MSRLGRFHYPTEKMGRPDIVHNTLLQVLETPLGWEGQLRMFVHTQDDFVITVNPTVRLPKNYVRFVGLIEQLYADRQVPKKGEALLKLQRMKLHELSRRLSAARVIGFSTLGKPALMRTIAKTAAESERPMVIVGGFPRGHFAQETVQLLNDIFCVDPESLNAWVVAGRFVYDYESALGLPERRLKSGAGETKHERRQ